MAVRAVAQKHREEASGKRVQDWQAGARLASGFTIGRRVGLALDEQMHDGQASARLARRCTMGEALHGWQGDARLARRCTMGEALHDGQAPLRQGNRVYGWQGDARRASTAAPVEPLAHRTAGCGTLLLFGWCA